MKYIVLKTLGEKKKKRPFAPLHPREIDKIIMKELILLYTQVEKQDKRSI